jgi:hypothetical protein
MWWNLFLLVVAFNIGMAGDTWVRYPRSWFWCFLAILSACLIPFAIYGWVPLREAYSRHVGDEDSLAGIGFVGEAVGITLYAAFGNLVAMVCVLAHRYEGRRLNCR